MVVFVVAAVLFCAWLAHKDKNLERYFLQKVTEQLWYNAFNICTEKNWVSLHAKKNFFNIQKSNYSSVWGKLQCGGGRQFAILKGGLLSGVFWGGGEF